MPTVSRTFGVRIPPRVAVAYLADFANAEEWDPGTVSCVRNDDGPVRVGASWHNTSKIVGITTELTYTLEALDEERRIVLVGHNDTATSTETIEVAQTATGSTITYTNELAFHGAAKVAAPLSKLVFEKLAGDTEKQLIKTLDALAVA